MNIPKRIVLPGKFIVRVVQLKDEAELARTIGIPEPGYSAYVDETRVIYLRKDRPIRLRRADLVHEVGHAYVDWTHWAYNTQLVEPKG